jgi:hypothetical protein
LNSAILLRDCHGRLLFIHRLLQLPRPIAMPQPASCFFADDRRTSAQRWRAIWVTIVACRISAGALFLYIFGDRFVFRFADAYTVIALASAGLSMPFILYRMARSRRVGEEF